MTHPALRLDDVVHQRVRLGILAVLEETSRADFGYLKGVLDLTDGNLSRHISVLEEAGLIDVEKGFENRRGRTWISVTPLGREALKSQLAALRELIDRVAAASAEPQAPASGRARGQDSASARPS